MKGSDPRAVKGGRKASSAAEKDYPMKTVVLDIETIPDLAACVLAGIDPREGFPPWPLHELMCVSLLTVERIGRDDLGFEVETFSRANHAERGIVAGVEHAISGANQIVTYNGRGFDIPVLLSRAVVVGEHVPTIAKACRRTHAGFHDDLIDLVSSHGAAPRPKLAHMCAALGIPAKMEAGGGGVAALAEAQDYDRIQRYCETDVVATWLLGQMWQSIDLPEFGLERWQLLANWICSNQPRLAHLLPYLEVPQMPGGGRSFEAPTATVIRL
jgi:predicted PolB exonuclease-like 3'-5' exonuclease